MSERICDRHHEPMAQWRCGERRGQPRLRWHCRACQRERLASVPPDAKRAWNARNPEKRRAHKKVENALQCGRLVRMPCSVCGHEKAQAHHHDYSKPLDIQWLCARCHGAEHRGPRKRQAVG